MAELRCWTCGNLGVAEVNGRGTCLAHLDAAMKLDAPSEQTVQLSIDDIPAQAVSPDSFSMELLKEWFVFWAIERPKVPDALHIRTALRLEQNGYDVLEIMASASA